MHAQKNSPDIDDDADKIRSGDEGRSSTAREDCLADGADDGAISVAVASTHKSCTSVMRCMHS